MPGPNGNGGDKVDGYPVVKSDFRIYRSPKLSVRETIQKLEDIQKRAELKLKFLNVKSANLKDRLARVQRLVKKGYEGPASLEKAQIELQEIEAQIVAWTHFQAIADEMALRIVPENFIDAPAHTGEETPHLHLRIPGLALRAGTKDFFTVKMTANADTTLAIGEYIESRLEQTIAYRHAGPSQEFFQNRHAMLNRLTYARQSELKRSRYFLSHLGALGEIANHEFATRISNGRILGRFDEYVAATEGNSQSMTPRAFAATEDSFWLFGDGKADAASAGDISLASLAIARNHTIDNHEIIRAEAKQAACEGHYKRLQSIARRGFSNGAELRKAKLQLDLAAADVKIARAKLEVAECEMKQLSAAIANTAPVSKLSPLPSRTDLSADITRNWLDWIVNAPTTDAFQMLKVLDLVENQFLAAVARKHAENEVALENRTMSRYQKIRSVQPFELEKQRYLQNQAIADRNEAVVNLEEANLMLQQWALNAHASRSETSPDEKTMENVIEAGLDVIAAREKAAAIEMEKHRLQNHHDRLFLSDLNRIQATTALEVLRAQNDVLRSSALMKTAGRQLATVRQQRKTLNALFKTGCLSYDRNGISVLRMTPKAVTELSKLASLIDGVDQGEVERIEADLSDCKARISALNGLIAKGYASPVEVRRADYFRKNLENQLATELAKQNIREKATGIIQTLDRKKDSDSIKPSVVVGQRN